MSNSVPKPAIEIDALSYRYSPKQMALNALTFSVTEGESIGLIGPNGAGKTTLFFCLCGVFQPNGGTIRVGGLDPSKAANRKQLPQQIGMVFQNSDDQLFCSSVAEDVAFGPLNLGLPREQVEERVTDALRQVGMEGQGERPPFQLSGGEKRRVAIAGILAMQPRVLLLDEPTMFLDPRGRRSVIKLINALPGTKLIASHDLRFIQDTCQRTLLLDSGTLIADGETQTILENRALLEQHGLVD